MNYLRLTSQEREIISVSLTEGLSYRAIARKIKRAPSTVMREVKRYSYKWREYHPILCHQRAAISASKRRRGKRKILLNHALRQVVEEKLKLFWSPEQIEKFLKFNYNDSTMQASKETIYTYVYVFMRRNMREEFVHCMRQGRKRRRTIGSVSSSTSRVSKVLGEIELIDERPSEAVDRLIPGHWEGDLMIGGAKEQSALGTLVERTTRFAILVPLKSKSAEEVRERFAEAINQLPSRLKRSLTYDQGSEMAQHRLFSEQTQMKVYFAHPRSPWERGTNENTNGLIRQFFPKGTNFRNVSTAEIKRAQDLLNERPRKTLGFKTPAEKMAELLR